MYAIVEVGAKQYSVKKDDFIAVEKQDVAVGGEIVLDKVILFSTDKKIEIGQPFVKGVNVKAEVLGQFRDEKKISFKYRRRKASHWKKGHRQQLTKLKIMEITVG
ncbi:MAG: 50S ribosomal protein L21 [Candidatus Omnitrophica bacterium]|nr:50S ribosomal protein L21 [Candidatus Omnitrophota bacterium]